jgi:hypothetical protein
MRHALQAICVLLASLPGLSSAQEPAGIPRDVKTAWSYLIGDWDVEGRIGSTPVKGTATFEWADGTHCYIGRQVWNVGENERAVYLTLIGGWNDAAQETVEQGFDSSGSAATVHYRVVGEKVAAIEGSIEGSVIGNGNWSGQIQVARTRPDEFQMTTTVDGEVVHSLKYKRTKVDRRARSEDSRGHPTPNPAPAPAKQQPAAERGDTSFNPLPLDNEWTRWIVGDWVGTGESDAGSGRGSLHIGLGFNGQFLIFTGKAGATDISAEQLHYLDTQLLATDEDMARFQAMPFHALEIYTIDQDTGEVIGCAFDSLRCVARGRGEWVGNTQIIEWKWASGHTSTRITTALGQDRLSIVERIAMPDGSTMEESGEMVRMK